MKHIIDKTSLDFDYIPMRLRESLQGNVLLELDYWKEGDPSVAKGSKKVGDLKGIASIDPESLTEIITDDTGGVIFPLTVNDPDELKAVAQTVGEARRFAGVPAQYHGKPFLEYIADDVNGEDKTGHRKNAGIFEEIIDEAAGELDEQGIKANAREILKTKFRQAKEK